MRCAHKFLVLSKPTGEHTMQKKSLNATLNRMRSSKTAVLASTAAALMLFANAGSAQSFFFSTGDPDGRIATATRAGSADKQEIESADDFVLTQETFIRQATFTGLLPQGTELSNVTEVVVEIYRVFTNDSVF